MNERSADVDPSEIEPTSKSARKREAAELKSIGLRMTSLSADERESLHLPPKIDGAISDYLRFPTHEARRRQLQFIGKLLRDVDREDLLKRLEDLEGKSADARYEFHQIEAWRDRLLSDRGALSEFIDTYSQVDRQALRHLLKKCASAKTEALQKAASRELFRFLRSTIQA